MRPESGARIAECSIPDVALVKANSVAFHDFANLFLEPELFVMFGLVEDIDVTDSTLDSLTEKAPYPFCQLKSERPFSFSRFDEAPFSRPIRSENAIFFESVEKT